MPDIVPELSIIRIKIGEKPMTERNYDRFDISRYDAQIYTAPLWESDVVVNESVFPLIGENGERVFRLAYPAKRIICVKSYTLEKTYAEGKDYALNSDGELFIPEDSSIPMREYRYLHHDENPDGLPFEVYYPHRKPTGAEPDRWEFWDESTLFSLQLLSVTYTHEIDGSIARPEAVGRLLPRTMEKLTSGVSLKTVAVGDSITAGAHASGRFNISPFAPPFAEMTLDALALKYPAAKIDFVNSGIGGGTSWAILRDGLLEERITSHEPDFVTICYGMNDSNHERVGISDESFRENILALIGAICGKLPDCEILLISSLVGNPYTFSWERYASHARILREIADGFAGKGIAFCDPQAIERQMLRRKTFADMMADNMCHPNDFGMRIIAQTVSDALRY